MLRIERGISVSNAPSPQRPFFIAAQAPGRFRTRPSRLDSLSPGLALWP